MELIYLSGPMTNDTNYRENFKYFEDLFEASGYRVFNPVNLSDMLIKKHNLTSDQAFLDENRNLFLREDVKAMLDCTKVVMLPGWKKSKGAKLERKIAEMLGMEVVYV